MAANLTARDLSYESTIAQESQHVNFEQFVIGCGSDPQAIQTMMVIQHLQRTHETNQHQMEQQGYAGGRQMGRYHQKWAHCPVDGTSLPVHGAFTSHDYKGMC
jgi:hypothetical protein